MARSVDDDARGIVDPAELLRRVTFTRHDPSPEVARLVSWYWLIQWDLDPGQVHDQAVLDHPVVNVVFSEGRADVHGVTRRRTSQRVSGQGWVLGTLFRPGCFRPLLDRPLRTITDRVLPLRDVVGPDIDRAVAAVAAAGPTTNAVARADAAFAALVPPDPTESEEVALIVERVAGDRSIVRVDQLAGDVGCSPRQLQRLFGEHVGLTPKRVIRRYRIYEVGERARRGDVVDWAAVAAELGYSDQAHLSRDFASAFGVPPQRYVDQVRAADAVSSRP